MSVQKTSPADITLLLRSTVAHRNECEVIIIHGHACDIGCHQLFLQRSAVKEFLQEPDRHDGSLAVTGNDDGAAVVVVRQIILKGCFYIAVCQLECLCCLRVVQAEKSLISCLSVPRSKYPAASVEYRSLVGNGTFISMIIHLFIVDVGVPVFAGEIGGGVDEEHICPGCILNVDQSHCRNMISAVFHIG